MIPHTPIITIPTRSLRYAKIPLPVFYVSRQTFPLQKLIHGNNAHIVFASDALKGEYFVEKD
jgi:hypothetical protein